MELSGQDWLEMYRLMWLTRRFEESAGEWYTAGRSFEVPHSSIGQEAVGVGTCYGLRADDQAMPSLRTRGAMFARGVPLNEMVATMAAKANGFSGGRETSHHAGVPECGVVVGSGIVGSSIAIATGVGLGLKVRGSDAVVVDFFGDGAASRGDFHEAINMAAVMKLPVIYVCENNLYALATPIARQTGNEDIYMRAAGYGIPGLKVDGNDVLAVYEATQAAIQRARAGGGPTLIECKTYRWRGHCEVPSLQKEPWRPNEEVAAWRQRCPIRRLRELILERGAANEQRLGEMETRIERELVEAIAFAAQSPDPMPEDALHGVYADEVMRS